MKKALTTLFSALLLIQGAFGQFTIDTGVPRQLYKCKDTLSVFILGDVMMHSRQMEYDCGSFLSDLQPRMKNADICIANMEFTVSGKPYSGYPCFSAPEYYPEYVAGCGADVFLVANNHILDRGSYGLDRTLEYYSQLGDSLGVRTCGTDGKALIVRKDGYSIALVNFTYGTNCGNDRRVNNMDTTSVQAAIAYAKEYGADFIIALPHWGDEYQLRHNKSQEEWAGWLVGKGVDAIIGSHPHVVQDTTHIEGVPVIYSMGNAISNMSAVNTRLELGVTLQFVYDGIRKKMLEPELTLLWCTLPGTLTDSYATIEIKNRANRRNDWLDKSDYDNMMSTARRVLDATGISCDY